MQTSFQSPSPYNPSSASLCSQSPRVTDRGIPGPCYLANCPSCPLPVLIFLSHTGLLSAPLVCSLHSSASAWPTPRQPLFTHTLTWPTPIQPPVPCSGAASSLKPSSLGKTSLGPLMSHSHLLPVILPVSPLPLLCSMKDRVCPILNTQDTCGPPNRAV